MKGEEDGEVGGGSTTFAAQGSQVLSRGAHTHLTRSAFPQYLKFTDRKGKVPKTISIRSLFGSFFVMLIFNVGILLNF